MATYRMDPSISKLSMSLIDEFASKTKVLDFNENENVRRRPNRRVFRIFRPLKKTEECQRYPL